MPPQAISWCDSRIAYSASLFSSASNRRIAFDTLRDAPEIAPIFIFHRDGFVRQAALETLNDPPDSPFMLAALAWRLNDWAEPVRAAAAMCASRVFPRIAPAVAVSASYFLLDRWRNWGRWEAIGVSLVDQIFDRPEVMAALIQRFFCVSIGPLGTEFKYAARGPKIDAYLLGLAKKAKNPVVRAISIRMIAEGYAFWPVGFQREWIDKRFGISKRVVEYARRPLTLTYEVDALIAESIRDRSALVRRAAADALINRRKNFPRIEEAIALLARDRSGAIRERADFLARHLNK